MSANIDRAIAKLNANYRISTPSPSKSLPWEAYWPGVSEDLRYFATKPEAQAWVLKKHQQTRRAK